MAILLRLSSWPTAIPFLPKQKMGIRNFRVVTFCPVLGVISKETQRSWAPSSRSSPADTLRIVPPNPSGSKVISPFSFTTLIGTSMPSRITRAFALSLILLTIVKGIEAEPPAATLHWPHLVSKSTAGLILSPVWNSDSMSSSLIFVTIFDPFIPSRNSSAVESKWNGTSQVKVSPGLIFCFSLSGASKESPLNPDNLTEASITESLPFSISSVYT